MRLVLMFSGVIPFAAGAVISLSGISVPDMLSAWPAWYQAYTLVIGSFMAGSLWLGADRAAAQASPGLLIVSNLAALGLWVANGLLGLSAFLIAAAFIFGGILACDIMRRLDRSYLQARIIVTGLVCLSLICVAISR
jgi:hypothetical protein